MTQAPDVLSEPRYLAEAGRSERVSLEWPFELDGTVWEHITVRRVTAGEVERFVLDVQRARESGEPTDDLRLPVFDAPDTVLKALDQDDADRLNEVAQRFLPRRFQERKTAPVPETGDGSAPA